MRGMVVLSVRIRDTMLSLRYDSGGGLGLCRCML